ncbi:unnamed protein product, partial [Candidula unifasciata]
NLVFRYIILPTYNLTFTDDLRDRNSEKFVAITTDFCLGMEKLFDQSIHGYRFYSCKVHAIRDDPPTITVSVGYIGGEWPGIDGGIQWVIRRHAPLLYVPDTYHGFLEVYRVGNNPLRIHFYIVFHGTVIEGLTSSIIAVIRQFGQPVYYLTFLAYIVGDILVLPEELPVGPSVFPTNITTLASSTLYSSMTSLHDTALSSASTTAISTQSGVVLVLYYEVYNLTFTEDLRNPGSELFKRQRQALCDDLTQWYTARNSPFIDSFRVCDLISFNPSPTGVTFSLQFDTPLTDNFAHAVRT